MADIEELLLSDRVSGRAYSAFITKEIDMEDKQKLLDHIDWIYTTKMGRILLLEHPKGVNSNLYQQGKQGKNWYCLDFFCNLCYNISDI